MQKLNSLLKITVSLSAFFGLNHIAHSESSDHSKLVDALNVSWEAIQSSSKQVADLEATFPSIADSFAEANSVSGNLSRQINRIQNRVGNLNQQNEELTRELAESTQQQKRLSTQVSDLLPEWEKNFRNAPAGQCQSRFCRGVD